MRRHTILLESDAEAALHAGYPLAGVVPALPGCSSADATLEGCLVHARRVPAATGDVQGRSPRTVEGEGALAIVGSVAA